MIRPSTQATERPTRRGWWMFQNTRVRATQSGQARVQAARPTGSRLSISENTSVKAMNQGFTGSRMYCVGWLGAGMGYLFAGAAAALAAGVGSAAGFGTLTSGRRFGRLPLTP